MRTTLAADPAESPPRPRIPGPTRPASACPRRCRGRAGRVSRPPRSPPPPARRRNCSPRRQAGKCAVAGQHDTGRAQATSSGSELTMTGARADLGGHCAETPFPPNAGCRIRSLRETVGHVLMPCRAPGRHSAPLVEGIASDRRGSGSTASRSARATDLNAASAMWWLFTPGKLRHMERDAAMGRKRLEELAHELGVERADLGRRERHVPDEERTRPTGRGAARTSASSITRWQEP